MPRTLAAAACVSPSARRRRRNADLIQACGSSLRRLGISGTAGLNNRAPIAAPARAIFDRYEDEREPLNVLMYFRFLGVL